MKAIIIGDSVKSLYTSDSNIVKFLLTKGLGADNTIFKISFDKNTINLDLDSNYINNIYINGIDYTEPIITYNNK